MIQFVVSSSTIIYMVTYLLTTSKFSLAEREGFEPSKPFWGLRLGARGFLHFGHTVHPDLGVCCAV